MLRVILAAADSRAVLKQRQQGCDTTGVSAGMLTAASKVKVLHILGPREVDAVGKG